MEVDLGCRIHPETPLKVVGNELRCPLCWEGTGVDFGKARPIDIPQVLERNALLEKLFDELFERIEAFKERVKKLQETR